VIAAVLNISSWTVELTSVAFFAKLVLVHERHGCPLSGYWKNRGSTCKPLPMAAVRPLRCTIRRET